MRGMADGGFGVQPDDLEFFYLQQNKAMIMTNDRTTHIRAHSVIHDLWRHPAQHENKYKHVHSETVARHGRLLARGELFVGRADLALRQSAAQKAA